MGDQTRYEFVDFLKGLGIFLVVWGHTMFPRSVYIYSFHMPLFFFLSGFLHKDKPARQFIIGKINTLYIPYAVFTILSWFFYLWRRIALQDYSGLKAHYLKLSSLVTGTANNGGNNPIWFLSCILVVSIAFLLISRIQSHRLRLIAVFGGSLIGYFLSGTKSLYFYVDVAFSGIVFYYLGYMVKRHNLLGYLDLGRRWVWIFSVILVGVAHWGTAFLNTQVASIRWVNMAGNTLGNYFLFYISACLGIFVYLSIGYWVQRLKILNFLGKNSLLILAVHKPLLLLFNLYPGKLLNNNAEWYGLLATLTVLLFTVPVIFFVNRKVPFIVGKKPVIS